jgi:hypothetical protein
MAASNNNNSLDHTELLNIAGLINSGIKAKIKPDPDPALVNASDLSGIQDAIVNYLLKQTTPPPPTGITWVTQPGAPIINATSVTETASSLNNNGTTVNVSGQTLTVPFAPAEGKRTDAIVINYSAVPAVYERIEGSTDHYLSPSAFPVVPTDRLFVRYLSVTDGQIQEPTTTDYTDAQAIAAAKSNIGTGSGQFAEGNHKHYFSYLEVTGDYTITAADHNRILIYNSVNPATFTMNDITQTGLNVIVHQINSGMVTFVKSTTGNHGFNVAGGGANANTRGAGGTVVLSSYYNINKYSWLYTYRGGADSGGGGAATTGTTERSWQVGQGTDGTTSTFEAAGTATDINAIIKPKGAGYAKLEGVNYTLANNKVLILDTAGNVKAEYEISEEQVAVPADLNSPGVPGTWAREAGFVYFCYGAGWEKMAAVGAALEYLEVYVAIPVSPTSTGTKGQRAYDSTNSFMYECIATNTWIRYTITKTW